MSDRDEDARIGGKVVDLGWGMGRWFTRWSSPFGLFCFIMFWSTLLKLVLLFLGLLLMAAFVPERVRLISEEAPLRPFMAFLAGLGAYIALVVVMVLFFITIIGIPVAILLYFVFVVLKWLGLVGLFHQIGRRLGRLFNLDLSLLPAVLLGFAPFALLRFLPFCIGTFISADSVVVGPIARRCRR